MAYKVIVSGMKKGLVRRCGNVIVEESELRRFFHDAGCKVAGVSLVMEPKRSDRSRGFSFVEFEDSESLDLALKLKNTEGQAGKDGKWRIEIADAAISRKRQQTVLEEKGRTGEMERELISRLNEFVWDVKQKCKWQNVTRARGLQLQEEKRRQAVLRQAIETINESVQRIHTAIEVEEERAMTINATVSGVHGEDTQRHKDESSVREDSFATLAFVLRGDLGPPAVTSNSSQNSGGATQGSCAIATLPYTAFQLSHKEPACKDSSTSQPDAAESTADDQRGVAIEDYLPLQAEQVEFCVRNTFVVFGEPEALPLRRTSSCHQ